MTTGLRKNLERVARVPVTNPGLVMERYLPSIQTGGENKDKNTLLERLAGATPTSIYKLAYDRWKASLESSKAVTHPFSASGSLTVGLASESVLETSLTLHPVYGMPYLPGDALKGLARHYFESVALDDAQTKAEYLAVLFGAQDNAAHLRYYDAWYIPKDGEHPLRREVLTVHHPNYYNRGERAHGPWDFDDPNPVPYLSAQGDYLVAVSCPTDTTGKWTDYALRLLANSLGDWGIGGKTSSGDGRLTPNPPLPEPGYVPPPVVSEWAAKIGLIKATEFKPRSGEAINYWKSLADDDPEKRQVAEALREKMIEARLWTDKQYNEKPWVVALKVFLGQ